MPLGARPGAQRGDRSEDSLRDGARSPPRRVTHHRSTLARAMINSWPRERGCSLSFAASARKTPMAPAGPEPTGPKTSGCRSAETLSISSRGTPSPAPLLRRQTTSLISSSTELKVSGYSLATLPSIPNVSRTRRFRTGSASFHGHPRLSTFATVTRQTQRDISAHFRAPRPACLRPWLHMWARTPVLGADGVGGQGGVGGCGDAEIAPDARHPDEARDVAQER